MLISTQLLLFVLLSTSKNSSHLEIPQLSHHCARNVVARDAEAAHIIVGELHKLICFVSVGVIAILNIVVIQNEHARHNADQLHYMIVELRQHLDPTEELPNAIHSSRHPLITRRNTTH